MTTRSLAAVVFALLAASAPRAPRANGFALDIQGAFSNGTASAGAASPRDPAGQFANPAVLGLLDGTQLVAGGMVIDPRAPYTDHGSTLLDGTRPLPGANGDGAHTGTVPWVFASHRLGPRLGVGFALTAPFGLATDYGRDRRFYGRYQGVESRIESLAFGPAVAWNPTPRLSLGVGAAARRDSAVLGQAVDVGSGCVALLSENGAPDPVGACEAAGLVPGESDGYARYSGTGWSWSVTGGVAWAPRSGTQLGVGYRHEAKGHVTGRETFDDAARAALGYTGEPRASLDLPLPDFLTVSAAQRLRRGVSLVAAFQYALWSRFDTVELVPEDRRNGLAVASRQGYRNAARVSLGAVWTVRPRVDVFGGAAFEQSPITDRYRQASLPERDSAIAGLGGEARLGLGLALSAVVQRVQMLGTSRIDQTGETGDRLVGRVRGSANLGVVQLGWRR